MLFFFFWGVVGERLIGMSACVERERGRCRLRCLPPTRRGGRRRGGGGGGGGRYCRCCCWRGCSAQRPAAATASAAATTATTAPATASCLPPGGACRTRPSGTANPAGEPRRSRPGGTGTGTGGRGSTRQENFNKAIHVDDFFFKVQKFMGKHCVKKNLFTSESGMDGF